MLNLDKKNEERDIFYLFESSVILKGLHAIVEIIGGLLALFVTQNFIIQSVLKITHSELNEDAKDFISNYLVHFAQNLSINSKHFIAFYLLSHGIVNGILAISLLRQKLWAYPTSIAFIIISMFYQIFRYTHTHSVWLIIFTAFDVIVVLLIWHEYKIRKNQII